MHSTERGCAVAVPSGGNVADLVTLAARHWPDSPALIDTVDGTALTWSGVEAAVDAQAGELRAAGVRAGDRVAVRLPTSAAFAISLYAVLRAGGIAVPLSPQGPAAELHGLLAHSGASLLLTRRPDDLELPAGVRALEPVLAPDGSPAPVAPGRAGEDIAVISYTSGTTGPSRGVMLSHRALLANVTQLAAVSPPVLEHSDRLFLAIPLFHVYGLGPGLLMATSVGATTVLAERFDAGKALAACAEHRVTAIAGVPAMYSALAALPADELGTGLATVRRLTSGAAPLHPKVLAAIRGAIGLGVYEGYGLTETAPVVTSTLVTGYPKPGSVGRPLPGVELRLVDSDGESGAVPLDPADPDDVFGDEDGASLGTGLVSVRGANLFSGYWPDGAHGPDAEGWYRTGDVGYLDVDGDLHLVDRAGDLIIVNGFNVYPHEVEEVIGRLPGVSEVAVVGVLDERTGEAVKAVLVPAAGSALSAQQVIEHCAAELAGYKVPRTVEFVEELPHSPTGKLRRVQLRVGE
ncbi:AMP-binding protein [Amycolatopsis aidingensis]|uniref:AMP-binding protein n=1 Tax=Amycolatopsis aidingensis TaxID=2842453 RepID=UPI001C0BE203|nr:AMP-binding protein [Amycolatopsis aidingensis]